MKHILQSYWPMIGMVLAAFVLLYAVMRKTKYTWQNCPNDHDTMSRHGFSGTCDKCGNHLS